MADESRRLDDRSDFNNRVLLFVVLTLIIGLPAYLAVLATTVWTYGLPYLNQMLFDPIQMGKTYAGLIQYWLQYREQLQADYTIKILVPTGLSTLTTLGTLFAFRAPLMDFRPFAAKESIHGDAHWATTKEIAKAGLFAKSGVLLGQYKKGKYYVADGFQHLLLFAPTGSGKGVGFAIPNLLFWDQSVCVHDIKLENYDLCSGWRAKMGQEVFVWNPADPNGITNCYNPMDWISLKPGQQVDDVQKIANLILPEQEFWQNEARSLLVGIVLYLVAVPEKTTSFGEVVRTMRSDDVTYNLAVVLDTIGKKIHPVAYMNIAAFLQKADKERSGVVSTMNSGLELWANPLIDTATASSDFSIMQWKKKKITVYCGVTPDNLQRLQPLLQVFYQQGSDMLTRQMPQPDEPYGVLFLLDEFPTLGKMPQFEAGIAYFRGYKVRLFLIVQDTQQLKGIYEEAGMNSFLSNATYRITFAANNVETANLISQLIGNKTIRQESHNMPKFLDLNPAARTKHVSEAQRALLLPQEVIQLPRDDQIVLIESQPPIRCKKIKYYEDPFFTKKLIEKTFVPTQEPYDPRKNDAKPADKPESKDEKKDEKAAAPNKPAEAKPPAAPAAGEAKKSPFDLPALPPKDGGDAAPAKPKSPFDLPPLPPKPGAANETPTPTATKPKSPFDLPPLPPKPEAASDAPATTKPKSPFDLPPLPPKPENKPAASPATSPFDTPAATKIEPTQAPSTKATSPFDTPAPKTETPATPPNDVKPSIATNPFDTPVIKAPKAKEREPYDIVTKDGTLPPDPFAATTVLKASKAPLGQPTPEKFGPPVPGPDGKPLHPFAIPTTPPMPKDTKPTENTSENNGSTGSSSGGTPPQLTPEPNLAFNNAPAPRPAPAGSVFGMIPGATPIQPPKES